jgi:superfamily II DNA or RNA helicase
MISGRFDAMTTHDPQLLLRSYQSLLTHQKAAMGLCALVGDAIPKDMLARALTMARIRSPDDKAWNGRSAGELLNALAKRGLLDRDSGCTGAIRHRVAVDAAEGEQRVALTDALARTLPQSERDQPPVFYGYYRYRLADDRDLFRRIRLAIYANDEAAFVRFRNLFERPRNDEHGEDGWSILAGYLAKLPADIEWLQRRAPAIRDALLASMALEILQTGMERSDVAAAIARLTVLRVTTSPALNHALLWRDILHAKLDSARARLAALSTEARATMAATAAVIDFLAGENSRAITGFREALKRFRKDARRRKCVLPGLAGVFHVLALLRKGDANLHAEVRNLLALVNSTGVGPLAGYRAARAMLEVACGHDDTAEQVLAQPRPAGASDVLSTALISLARLHVDIEAARGHAAKDEKEFDRVATHLPLVGRIYAEILIRTSSDPARWRGVVSNMGMDGVIAFTDIIGFKPRWERAFDRLTAFLAPTKTQPVDAVPAQVSKRLVFMVNPQTKEIEALEQAAKGGSWTAGRPVGMKRLYEQDSKLDYLTAADRRVLATIVSQPGWYSGREYFFDECKSLIALIGHPNVFDARDRGRRVELVAYPVELVVSEAANGFAFKLSHRAAAPEVFIEADTPTRWRVIEVTKQLVDLQATLGEDRLVVPSPMRERVIALLRTDHPMLPIRSELVDVEVEAIEGIPMPVLQLRLLGGDLSVALVVRPLGPDGPSYVPGHGGRSVFAATNGTRRRVNRDLAAERAAVERLVAECSTLEPWRDGEHGWRIEGLESSLAFLEEVQSAKSSVAFEWPEGGSLKVTRQVGGAQLRLKIASARDWFEISGDVVVDEDLVLDMQDVLARLDNASGRFVPLDGGRFLALTAELKRQLQRLHRVSDESRQGRRIHGLGIMAMEDLVESAGTVSADSRWRELVAKIRAAGEDVPSVPATLHADLRDYQREGFIWLSRLARLEMGACLADDMGLGKTVQAIALLLEQAEKGASLVVAPTSVCHNWEREFARFAPTLKVCQLAAVADRRACVDALGTGDVLIASYGLVHQDVEALTARPWNVIVFDEAQNLKNVDTKRAQASQRLEARLRLALSGTPIENYLEELWSLFNTINPGLLGSRERFVQRFAAPIGRGNGAAQAALRELIRPFILRRTKTAVLSELPPRTELTIEVMQSEEERAFYEALRRQALATLATLDGPSGQRKIHILAEIMRLRRACCHPGLIDQRSTLESSKLQAFVQLIDELLRNGHKALVFSQFIGHLAKVREALDRRGLSYQYIDGQVPAQQRAARVAAFQAGAADLFLISLKAGGTGLNLTAADYVIHLDPWWNPAVEDQASDRAHRIGQTRPVTVYRLIVADSIEERILELHQHKRDLAANLLEGAEASARLSEEELIALIRQ